MKCTTDLPIGKSARGRNKRGGVNFRVRIYGVREGVDETNFPVTRRVYDPNALAAHSEQESTLTHELSLSGSDILLGLASALVSTTFLLNAFEAMAFVPQSLSYYRLESREYATTFA